MSLKLVDRGGYLHIHGKFMGQQVRKSTGCTERDRGIAEKMLAKEVMRISELVRGDITVEEAINAYEMKLDRAGRLTKNTEYMLKEWRRVAGERMVSEMNASTIEDIINASMASLQDNSIRRKLNVLSAAINYSASLGRCDTIKIAMPKVDDARDMHLNIEEIRDFLEWVEVNVPQYKFAFTMLIDSGVRLSEMRKLRWRDFDEEKVFIRRKVNGKPRTRSVPLSRRLRAEVNIHKGAPSALCFGRDGKEWVAASVTLGKVLRRWANEYGIEGLRVHDLRHTFAWQCAYHGCDLGELQILMGHSNISMTMRYRGFIMSKAKGVINAFD